jgi:hypothetical protein
MTSACIPAYAGMWLEYAKMEARPARSRPAHSRLCVTAARRLSLCAVAAAPER